eukprot:5983150-Pleurochrysis_carterae.AAC.3
MMRSKQLVEKAKGNVSASRPCEIQHGGTRASLQQGGAGASGSHSRHALPAQSASAAPTGTRGPCWSPQA